MKERLDKFIARKNLVPSREKARAYILGGSIRVDGETVRKPGLLVDDESRIEIRLQNEGFVSRGGMKLKKALRVFTIRPDGRPCLDIGASTGGFTDCLLQAGASSVTAVDVGKNQLAYKLRRDSRVCVVEGFNARYIDRLKLTRTPSVVTVDVSFISIRLILEPLAGIITGDTDVICLIKPQFELSRPLSGFKGVVGDPAIHRRIIKDLNKFFPGCGYRVLGYTFSPLQGPKGNIEFFVHLRKKAGEGTAVFPEDGIDRVVEDARSFFQDGV